MDFIHVLLLVALKGLLDNGVHSMPANRVPGMSPELFYNATLPLYPTLVFAEWRCNSSEGRFGRCVGYPECEGPLMVREGSCSSGFGVCCIDLDGLDETEEAEVIETETEDGIVHFSNPDYPLPSKQPTWYHDFVISPNVCQVRFDLDEFDLPQLRVFQVSLNGAKIVPALVGNNSGQHLIVDIEDTAMRPAHLELSVSGPPMPTLWKGRMQHFPCKARSELAPKGCLQYHRASSGHLRSLSVAATEAILYAVCLQPPEHLFNVVHFRSMPNQRNDSCRSFLQIPAGFELSGGLVRTKVCPKDAIDLTYRVSGPLVLYMATIAGHPGIDVDYRI